MRWFNHVLQPVGPIENFISGAPRLFQKCGLFIQRNILKINHYCVPPLRHTICFTQCALSTEIHPTRKSFQHHFPTLVKVKNSGPYWSHCTDGRLTWPYGKLRQLNFFSKLVFSKVYPYTHQIMLQMGNNIEPGLAQCSILGGAWGIQVIGSGHRKWRICREEPLPASYVDWHWAWESLLNSDESKGGRPKLNVFRTLT